MFITKFFGTLSSKFTSSFSPVIIKPSNCAPVVCVPAKPTPTDCQPTKPGHEEGIYRDVILVKQKDGHVSVYAPDAIADKVILDQGSKTVIGTSGHDHIIYTGTGEITLNGYSGDDIIENNGVGPSNLYGGDGSDILLGNRFDDLLNGGVGNDYLIGKGGNDLIIGGVGADTIVFQLLDKTDGTGGNGVDTWIDFDIKQDKINISELLSGKNVNTCNVNEYLSFEKNGNDVVLSIDRDGKGKQFSSEEFLVLTDQPHLNSLNDLINAHSFIV